MKRGVNVFDTSPYYGATHAETVLGRALRLLPRNEYVLCTKVGRYGSATFDFSAERVTKSVEESMSRLGVEYLDVVQCHDVEFVNLDQIITETIPALKKLKDNGKIRAIGFTGYPLEIYPYILSCCDPGSIDVILSYCHYNLQNDRLKLLLPALKRFGVGVFNASVLGMGLLTPSGGPDWHPADDETKNLCEQASAACVEQGENLPNVALKYSFQADVTSTFVGIDSVATLEKNISSLESLESPLIKTVQGILKPVHNRRWDSGTFLGIA